VIGSPSFYGSETVKTSTEEDKGNVMRRIQGIQESLDRCLGDSEPLKRLAAGCAMLSCVQSSWRC
jgi:hypothetical protein